MKGRIGVRAQGKAAPETDYEWLLIYPFLKLDPINRYCVSFALILIRTTPSPKDIRPTPTVLPFMIISFTPQVAQ